MLEAPWCWAIFTGRTVAGRFDVALIECAGGSARPAGRRLVKFVDPFSSAGDVKLERAWVAFPVEGFVSSLHQISGLLFTAVDQFLVGQQYKEERIIGSGLHSA